MFDKQFYVPAAYAAFKIPVFVQKEVALMKYRKK